MVHAVRIGEDFGVAFIDADFRFAARTPRCFFRGVMDFDGIALDDQAQIAAREIDALTVAGRDKLDGFTVLLGDLDRNDQATIDHVGFVLVRPDDERVVAVRGAVAEMLAHHPVQVRIFKPAVFAQKRIESLALVWIGRASGNGLTHFL